MDVSHFSMVGFMLDTRDEAAFSRAALVYLADCPLRSLSDTAAVCLVKDASGGELRLAVQKDAAGRLDFTTANPAFDGESEVSVEIEGDVSDPEWKTFEKTVSARFAGEETPLAFDLADPAQAEALKPGTKVKVEIAAFAFEPEVYRDEAAFAAAQKAEKVRFASTFFIPTGHFTREAGGMSEAGRPTAYADFAGVVLKAERRKNVAGKGGFWWALVRGYGGATFDVVVDPKTIHQDPKPGAVITGRFWLSARLASKIG